MVTLSDGSVLFPLSNGSVTVVDASLVPKLQALAPWHLSNLGYAFSNHGDVGRIMYLHHAVIGKPATGEVDHINRVKLDNRRENLRLCTRAENARNIAPLKTKAYKGVKRRRELGGWRYVASIHCDGRDIYLGVFKCQRDAAMAYNNAAQHLFGEFAYLNVL